VFSEFCEREVNLKFRPFQSGDESAVIDLWHRCDLVRPQNDPHREIQRKISVQPELFIVAEMDGAIIGSVMIGYDGHRGWINYLGVLPEHRRHGIGQVLMAEAERLLRKLGCVKINLQVRTSNREVLAFYHAIGFNVDDVVSMGKRLEID
jgi:ribosomal protein S18 acetylase RimI-like enzyme